MAADLVAWAASVAYRAGQFARAVTARPEADSAQELSTILPPDALRLFFAMPANDQRHARAVYAWLSAGEGERPRRPGQRRALLQAALLHDVGKADAALTLWHRVAIVLLRAWRPDLLEQLANDQPGAWGYPFWLHLHHPARGAALAASAGCDRLAVVLIRRHQDALPATWQGTDKAGLWQALKEADDRT